MLTSQTACKWCSTEDVLLVARRHVVSPFEMTLEEWTDLGEMITQAQAHLAQFHPAGFTIGWNVGEAGGQHVFHAHMHVISRFDYEPQTGRGLRDFVLR
ncbi:HIT domain-containing protein [Rhizobium leguminosarum]|uniref:HIT family protein n=1 Tax=Rhizobium ruizarguesonis TaxID=2081791 RepID=UPI0013DEA72F|nr:HIT domain-containing protein [Rhizobium ruizarguesonis]NEJ90050.1 HIT domain-containing protein [Rhizobium ruizarguesonis]